MRVAAALLSLLCTLALLEGGYRAYKLARYGFVDYVDLTVAGYFVAHPVYGYALAKNFSSEQVPDPIRRSVYGINYSMGTKFTTNSLGYHSPEFSPAKPPGVFRIVTFGGSTTQGLEVDDGLNWPAQLEAFLNSDNFAAGAGANRVEVINAAVGGWRSLENMLRLRDEVSRFAPDMLLLVFNWNDSWKALRNNLPFNEVTSIERPLWSHVKIFENLRSRYLNYQTRNERTIRNMTAGLRDDAAWAIGLRHHILEMNNAAERIGARVVVIALPGLCRPRDLASPAGPAIVRLASDDERLCRFWAALNEFEAKLFLDLGDDSGIPVINVREAFERFESHERTRLFTDVMHLTVTGSRETAAAVARGVRELAPDIDSEAGLVAGVR